MLGSPATTRPAWTRTATALVSLRTSGRAAISETWPPFAAILPPSWKLSRHFVAILSPSWKPGRYFAAILETKQLFCRHIVNYLVAILETRPLFCRHLGNLAAILPPSWKLLSRHLGNMAAFLQPSWKPSSYFAAILETT